MIDIEMLKNMPTKELEQLIELIKAEIESRKPKDEFTFTFEATSDPRKGVPFVAKLTFKDGRIQREFFDLSRTYGKKQITVSGTYTAKAGDIIEKRTGGSWKNDYRAWYLVTETGEEILVADIDDSKKKLQVEKYLKGEITMEQLKAVST